MGFIGGTLQRDFVARVKDRERERLLAASIDVGKRTAAAMVCDFWGEIVVEPFSFPLNEHGFSKLSLSLAGAAQARDALWIRIGLEQAGHYHHNLLARLSAESYEIALLNPAQVAENRNQDLLRSLKSDARDLGAIADLVIRGKGRGPEQPNEAMARQLILATQRARKIKARSALKNQILATLDLVFPGLGDCFENLFESRFARLLLAHGFDPPRVRHLGAARLRSFCCNRGLRPTRAKVAQVVAAAHDALLLPEAQRALHAKLLARDASLLDRLDEEIAALEQDMAEVLIDTPAAVLTTMPGVAVVRASNYGAALGDPGRFRSAAQVYRLSGLVPRHYESAGRRRAGTHISKEGSVALRQAILELGMGLRLSHHGFRSYARSLEGRGKGPGVIACALGRKANRIAFAMVREQRSFESSRS